MKEVFKVKRLVILILSFSLLLIGVTACSGMTSGKVFKIGISQLAEHPALDSAREGFIEALKEAGYEDGKNIKIEYQNAQGDVNNAQTIARKFTDENVDMILAIATQAARLQPMSQGDTDTHNGCNRSGNGRPD